MKHLEGRKVLYYCTKENKYFTPAEIRKHKKTCLCPLHLFTLVVKERYESCLHRNRIKRKKSTLS